MDGIVRRMSGKCVNWFPLRFSEVHCVSSSKLSGSVVSVLCDKSIATSMIYKNTSTHVQLKLLGTFSVS